MVERSIPTAVRQELETPSTDTTLTWFVVLTHPNLKEPIRVVSDVIDFSYEGNLYQRVPFEAKVLNDNDELPFTQLAMQNVDKEAALAIRKSNDPVRVEAFVISSLDFDLTQDPRVAKSGVTPEKLYHFSNYRLRAVDGDPIQISGRVEGPNYSIEPWPGIRATEDRCPGLFT